MTDRPSSHARGYGRTHPGLGLSLVTDVHTVSLEIVTRPRTASQEDVVDRFLASTRAQCAACKGDAELCRRGTARAA